MAFIQKGGKKALIETVESVQETMIKIKQLSSDIKSQIANMTKFKADVSAINSKILEIQEDIKIYYTLLETVSLTRNIQIDHLQAKLTCCESELTKTLDKLTTVTQGETIAESKSQGIIEDLKKQIQNSKDEIQKLKKTIHLAEIEKEATHKKVQMLNTETDKLKSELDNTMTELSNLAKGIQIQGEGNLFVGGATQGPTQAGPPMVKPAGPPGAGQKVKVNKLNTNPVVQKKIGQVIQNKTFTYGNLLQQLDTIKRNAENTKINIEQFLKTELQMNIDEFVTNDKFKKMVSNKTIPVDLRYTAETVQIKYNNIRIFRTLGDGKSYKSAKLYYYNKEGNKTSYVDPIAIKLGATHIFDNEKIFNAGPGQTFKITNGKINKKPDRLGGDVSFQLVWCMNKVTKEVTPAYFNTQTKEYTKEKPTGIIFANDTFVIDPPVCSCSNNTNKQIKVINQAKDAKKQLVGNIKKIGVSKTPLNTDKIKEIKKMDKQINRDKKSDEREAKKQQEKTDKENIIKKCNARFQKIMNTKLPNKRKLRELMKVLDDVRECGADTTEYTKITQKLEKDIKAEECTQKLNNVINSNQYRQEKDPKKQLKMLNKAMTGCNTEHPITKSLYQKYTNDLKQKIKAAAEMEQQKQQQAAAQKATQKAQREKELQKKLIAQKKKSSPNQSPKKSSPKKSSPNSSPVKKSSPKSSPKQVKKQSPVKKGKKGKKGKKREGYVINEEGIVHLDNLSESIDLPTIYNYRYQ